MISPPGEACPVCRWPGQQNSKPCEHCGWQPGIARSPGTVAAQQDRFADPLADLQWEHDLRALARVARVTGERDKALLTLVARVVRGAPPDATQIDQAVLRANREDERPGSSSSGLVYVLTRLVAGKTDAVAFIEIGTDALSVQTLTVAERGALQGQVSDSLPWSSLLPLLPTDIGLRYLRMAGGVGVPSQGLAEIHARQEPTDLSDGEDTGPAGLLDAVDDAITPALRRLVAASSAAAALGRGGRSASDPDGWDILESERGMAIRRGSSGLPGAGTHRVDTVLVRRTHAWPLLEEAAARVRAVLRPVAEILALDTRTLAEVVADATVRAPLRYPYDLVLADVDRQAGAIRPVTRRLYPSGISAEAVGLASARTIELAPADEYGAAEVLLPVVEWRGPVPDIRDQSVVAERWPLVQMLSLAPGEKSFTLRSQLIAPGKVELAVMPGQLASGDRRMAYSRAPADNPRAGWPELLAEVQDRLGSLSTAVDLVLLLELGEAGGHKVADRVALVRDLVEEFRYESGAKIAVLGYRDHFGMHRVDAIAGPHAVESEALIVGCGLSSPAGALAVLSRPELWEQVPVNDDYAAPVECALGPLLDKEFGWRQGARHTVLIIGRRPPHPERARADGDVMLPCPHRHSWKRTLAKLRRWQAIECIAVLDHRPATLYAKRTWEQLAERGTRWLGTAAATPRQLKQATGVPVQTARLQLATLTGAEASALRGREAGS